jgi:hypothetical protein
MTRPVLSVGLSAQNSRLVSPTCAHGLLLLRNVRPQLLGDVRQ